MVWEWQTWRCLGDLAEELEHKGWEVGFRRDELPPLLGWSGRHCIVFRDHDTSTGERRFELRDDQRVASLVEIPTPEKAADLLSERGVALATR